MGCEPQVLSSARIYLWVGRPFYNLYLYTSYLVLYILLVQLYLNPCAVFIVALALLAKLSKCCLHPIVFGKISLNGSYVRQCLYLKPFRPKFTYVTGMY